MNFNNLEKKNKAYGGANGKKISVSINNELYMLKFPSESNRNTELSYLNGTISEYLGCHIFETLDIPVQKTILGTYTTKNNKTKIVVACKDFTVEGDVLQDFASFKNQIIDSTHNGNGTELDSIMETIELQEIMSPEKLKDFFWDVFIVDAFIGNWDRHNGNWGFLYNQKEDTVKIAPIYDCGSCLYPSADDVTIQNILDNEDELKIRIYERPTSAIRINDKRIRFYDFISSLDNKDCNDALARIYPKVNIDRINEIIDNTPYINDLHKRFYKTVLKARFELILKHSYEKLMERLKNKEIDFLINKLNYSVNNNNIGAKKRVSKNDISNEWEM